MADALQEHIDLTLKSSVLPYLLIAVHQCIEAYLDSLGDGKTKLKIELLSYYCAIIHGSRKIKDIETDNFLSQYPTVVDFLEYFGPILCERIVTQHQEKVPLLSVAQVLTILPHIHERTYSISSTPKDDNSKVSITVSVVHAITSAGISIHGIGSNYLARLYPFEDEVRLSVRKSHFRGPKLLSAPVIMIGAGTGLSPLMGFLSDRRNAHNPNKDKSIELGYCHLFFGFRREEYITYKETIDMWKDHGLLENHLAL